MYNLQEALESAVEKILEQGDYDLDASQLQATVTDALPGIAEETADVILSRVKNDAFSGGLEEVRADRRGFEERLIEVWRKPIDLLELFISLAAEAGTDFNREFRHGAVRADDPIFEALTRLHGRACQVAKEILVLLRSGYADGAHARWRTLHEIAVVACFIGQNEQGVAERYLLHRTIQQYKQACHYQKHYARLGHDPISEEEFNSLEEERDRLMGRLGTTFKNNYGWASSAMGIKNPTLVSIEEKVDLAHWRPYYSLANGNVHPTTHGTYFRLGLAANQDNVILAGPSNMGLADPGHSTAISLLQTTEALIATRSSFDSMVISGVLQNLADQAGEAFLEVHRFVERLSDRECEVEANA